MAEDKRLAEAELERAETRVNSLEKRMAQLTLQLRELQSKHMKAEDKISDLEGQLKERLSQIGQVQNAL